MTIWPLIAVLVLFFLGVPCSFAMLFCTIPYFHFDPFIKMAVVAQKMIANCESTSLMAIPFFITAGSIMGYSGITEKLMAFGNACVGHLVGGLGHVNVLVSVLMGGAVNVIGNVTSGIFNTVIGLVFALYCLAQKDNLGRQGRSILPEKYGRGILLRRHIE